MLLHGFDNASRGLAEPARRARSRTGCRNGGIACRARSFGVLRLGQCGRAGQVARLPVSPQGHPAGAPCAQLLTAAACRCWENCFPDCSMSWPGPGRSSSTTGICRISTCASGAHELKQSGTFGRSGCVGAPYGDPAVYGVSPAPAGKGPAQCDLPRWARRGRTSHHRGHRQRRANHSALQRRFLRRWTPIWWSTPRAGRRAPRRGWSASGTNGQPRTERWPGTATRANS